MKELSISEELLLLSFDRTKKNFPSPNSAVIKYGLPATVLWELVQLGICDQNKKIITPKDKIPPRNDPFLDLVIKILPKSPKKISNLIIKLGSKSKQLKKLLMTSLIEKKAIKEMPAQKGYYQIWYEKPLQQTRSRLQQVLEYGKKDDESILNLLAIIHGCRYFKKALKNYRFPNISFPIGELAKKNDYAKSIRSIILGVQLNAVFTAIPLLILLITKFCSS